jgi:hypothetical protein
MFHGSGEYTGATPAIQGEEIFKPDLGLQQKYLKLLRLAAIFAPAIPHSLRQLKTKPCDSHCPAVELIQAHLQKPYCPAAPTQCVGL